MDGFTGDFCEFKTGEDHILAITSSGNIDYPIITIDFIFNAAGERIRKKFNVDDQSGAYGSCSTMLNGEAFIFGGYDFNNQMNMDQQVYFGMKKKVMV